MKKDSERIYEIFNESIRSLGLVVDRDIMNRELDQSLTLRMLTLKVEAIIKFIGESQLK